MFGTFWGDVMVIEVTKQVRIFEWMEMIGAPRMMGWLSMRMVTGLWHISLCLCLYDTPRGRIAMQMTIQVAEHLLEQ